MWINVYKPHHIFGCSRYTICEFLSFKVFINYKKKELVIFISFFSQYAFHL